MSVLDRRTPLLFLIVLACGSKGSDPTTSEPGTALSATASENLSAASVSSSIASAEPQRPLTHIQRELIAAPDAAQRDRLKADVVRVAIERTPGSNGWNQVRTLVTQSLDPAAFVVETHSFDALGKNVVGTKQGTGREKEIVILSAHYDHIAGCKGADDNASGVAVVMEAARVLSKRTFVRTLVLAFWDREEDGLLGSRAWATRAKSQGVDIRTMISLDGVGFANRRPGSQTLPPGAGELLPAVAKRLAANDGRADFIAGLGDTASSLTLKTFERIGESVQQSAFGIELSGMSRLMLMDAARSDHASFWLAGYPGILVTDTANFRNPHYHCRVGQDDPSTLDYEFLNKVATVVIRTVEDALLPPADAP